MIGGLEIPGFGNVARSPRSTTSSARLDYSPLDPGELEDDLLLVSQIGGLRARSAQAQAASAKLTAAIEGAREQQCFAKVHRRQFREARLSVLSSWLSPPSEKLARLFAAWRFVIVSEARSREAERAKQQQEAAEARLEKLRETLLNERREVRLEAARQNIKCGQRQSASAQSPTQLPLGTQAQEVLKVFFGTWQWSWRLLRRGNSRRLRTGSVEHYYGLPRPAYQVTGSCLSPRPRNASKTVTANARRVARSRTRTSPESPTSQATNGFSPQRAVDLHWMASFTERIEKFILARHVCSSLLGSVFWAWRQRAIAVACAVAMQTAEEPSILGDNSKGKMICALDGVFMRINQAGGDESVLWFFWQWRFLCAMGSHSSAILEVRRQECERRRSLHDALSGRWLQMHISLYASIVLALWASSTLASKCESEWSAKFTHMRVLQRRALSAVLSSGLESEQSWCASQIFYIWSLEALRTHRQRLQSLLASSGISHSATRSRMLDLFESSQHDLQRECLAFVLSTWRLFVSRQYKFKLAKTLASFAVARSSFVQSKSSLERVFWLRNIYEVLVVHAKTEAVMRQLQAYEHDIVSRVASERNLFCSRRSRHAERIQAHIACMERHEAMVECFRQWFNEVKLVSFMKRCTRIRSYLEKSFEWMDKVPQCVCWIAWQSWHRCSRRISEDEAWMQSHEEMLAKLAAEKLEREKLLGKVARQEDAFSNLKLEREKLLGKIARQEDAFGKLCFALTHEVEKCSDQQSAVRDAISALAMTPSWYEDELNQDEDFVVDYAKQGENGTLKTMSDGECDDQDVDATIDGQRAITQVQSPLTASSPWIVNVWNGPPTQKVSGIAAPPAPPPGMLGEEQFMRRCGELTTEQENFIAKLRENDGMLPGDLGDQQASGQDVPEESGPCAWYDASQPLSVTKFDTLTTQSQCVEAGQIQAPVAEKIKQASSDPGYWGDVSLPLFDGQQVEQPSADKDVVCRRLSFGTKAGASGRNYRNLHVSASPDFDVPSISLQELAARKSSGIHHENFDHELQLQELAVRQSPGASQENPDEVKLQDFADRKTSSIHDGLVSPRSKLQELASREATARWHDALIGEEKVDFQLTSDALAEPPHSMDVQDQGMHTASHDKLPVWRWHTWSAGDVPPSEADEDQEMVQVQTSESLGTSVNLDMDCKVATASSQLHARRPSPAQLKELRQLLDQDFAVNPIQSLASMKMESKASCTSESTVCLPSEAQLAGLRQMLARSLTDHSPAQHATMEQHPRAEPSPENTAALLANYAALGSDVDASKMIPDYDMHDVSVFPSADQTANRLGTGSSARRNHGGVLNDMPSQLFAAKLQTFSFGMSNLASPIPPGGDAQAVASPREQSTVPEVLAKLHGLIGTRSPQ